MENKDLDYETHFILGVESSTEKGRIIFGKEKMDTELDGMFDKINNHNEVQNTKFGLDAGFVFLPEFYVDDRSDTEAIKSGFVGEITSFIDKYAGKNVPLRINIHPYYKTHKMPYESATKEFDILMDAMPEIEAVLKEKNESLPEHLRVSVFIGVNDSGYETEEWRKQLEKWKEDIKRINEGGVSESK